MGKSPAKWFTSLLQKKKSSPKSNLSKGGAKLSSSIKEESPVASKVTVTLDCPSISPPIPPANNVPDQSQRVAVGFPNNGVEILSTKEIEDGNNSGSMEVPAKMKDEQAATMMQAAFRGYQARRAFQTLKGIIRLQAVIRGHLVRRQAVATLSCMWGIVKFQALARGRKVRSSNGKEIQQNRMEVTGSKSSETLLVEKLSKNAFIRKLLSLLPTAMPLRLQYAPGEPNSALEWLERWTQLRFWGLRSLEAKKVVSKPQMKKGNLQNGGKPKRNMKKTAYANVDDSTPENEKPKRNIKKVSGNPSNSTKDSKNEIDKGKNNLRKSTNSLREVAVTPGVNKEKSRANVRNASTSAVPVKVTSETTKEIKDVEERVVKVSDLEPDTKLPIVENPDHLSLTSLTLENNDRAENIVVENAITYSKDDNNASTEYVKGSNRRASLPAANVDHQDDGPRSSTRKVPSYMAPTASAKARLKEQGSPRFSQDSAEKNGVTRRYSLPSSANGKILSSVSPRAQGLVLASGKGVVNSDRSLSSSRDAGDKMIKADWRR